MIQIYTDGAYNPVLNQGGWAAVVVESGQKRVFSGLAKRTTSNRMEITAALEGIGRTPQGAEVVVYTDSQYLFGCMTKGWQRRANRDLWQLLDAAISQRKVYWQWIDRDTRIPFHKEAHALATDLATQGERLHIVPAEKPRERPQAPKEVPGRLIDVALSKAVSLKMLRIIDANMNRIGEGLRLLEDLARLLLNDAGLTQQLKTMRHELVTGNWSFNRQLIQARDSEGDVGIDIGASAEEKQRELPTTVVANARRVQESLRVMEELAKIPETKLDPEKFKQARFNLYTIEQNLLSKLLRQDMIKRVVGLYVIIDTQALKGRSHIEVAAQAIRGGAKAVQLRDKLSSKRELLPLAQQLKNLCAENGVPFIINDYLDLVLATDADGLHLGQDDLPISAARKLLPIGKILGCSTRTVDQATAAESEGVDYIAVGSIYPTPSKETAEVVGLDRLRQIRQAVTLPLVAIGGITRDNVAEVIAAGADAVAVISGVLGAENVEDAARQIVVTLEAQK